jgi:hypothetical protein
LRLCLLIFDWIFEMNKNPSMLGIEPRISSLGGTRLIHWATRMYRDFLRLSLFIVDYYIGLFLFSVLYYDNFIKINLCHLKK